MEQIKSLNSISCEKRCSRSFLIIQKASQLLLDLSFDSQNQRLNELPLVSLEDYLESIVVNSEMEQSTLIVAIILIIRLSQSRELQISSCNIHLITFASVVIAIKLNEDVIFTNEEYAIIGGISLSLLNELELIILMVLNFQVHVNRSEFREYKELIEFYHTHS